MPLTSLRGLEERLVVDTSEGRPSYLLVAENGSHLRLSSSSYHLLRQISKGITFEQLAAVTHGDDGRQVSAAELEAAHERLIERIVQIDARGEPPKGAFSFRRRLVPGALVARSATVLSAAFHPGAIAVLITAIFAAFVLAARFEIAFFSHLAAGEFWSSYALFLVSLMAHEMGHASACARYGGKPSDIGLIVYFIYPSFYSDVTSAWGLKRWQRVVVDLGGVYFQLVFAAACVVAHALTHWGPLRGAVLLIMSSCVFSLNPIMKFDGYWVIADALGVTNLGKQPMRIARHLVDRGRGRAVRPLPWPAPVTTALFLYSMATFGFWAWFIWRLLPAIVHHLTRYAEIAPAFGRSLLSSQRWPGWASVREFATSSFMLFFMLLVAGRLLRPVLAWLRAKVQRRP